MHTQLSRRPPERSTYRDPETGAYVTRWTESPAKDQHFYFTGPSVTHDDRWLTFISERDGSVNLFAIDRESGEIHRLTDNPNGQLRSYAYPRGGIRGISKASPYLDARRQRVFYVRDDAVWTTPVVTPSPEKLCDLPEGWWSAYLHGTPSGDAVIATCTPPEAFVDTARSHLEQLIAVPRRLAELRRGTRLICIDAVSGGVNREVELPFWCTHAQACPAGSGKLLLNQEGFVAEGPSKRDIVSTRKPRIWILEPDGALHPLYDEAEDEWACHENWTPGGEAVVYHGVRGRGSRMFDPWTGGVTGRHFIAMRSAEGRCLVERSTGDITVNHTTPIDARLSFLCDRWDGRIGLLVAEEDGVKNRTVCRADSTDLDDQDNHVHPRLTPSGNSVVFTSNRAGVADVYEVALPPGAALRRG